MTTKTTKTEYHYCAACGRTVGHAVCPFASQPSLTVTRHLPLRARMLKGQSLTVTSHLPLRGRAGK